MPDIVVTLPAATEWPDYEKELEAVKDGRREMHFKVPSVRAGDRCYVVHRGAVRGWMAVTGTRAGGFTCSTTGRKWEGNFVSRSGPWHAMGEPRPMAGFQEFRYAEKAGILREQPFEEIFPDLDL